MKAVLNEARRLAQLAYERFEKATTLEEKEAAQAEMMRWHQIAQREELVEEERARNKRSLRVDFWDLDCDHDFAYDGWKCGDSQ